MTEAKYSHNHIINPETGFLENPAYATDFDSARKLQFLEIYKSNGLGLFRTCRQLGLSCSTVHKHYSIDPKFKEAFDEAKKEYADELQATSRINALNPRSVIERIFQLKALFPGVYGDAKNSSEVVVNLNLDLDAILSARNRTNVVDTEMAT